MTIMHDTPVTRPAAVSVLRHTTQSPGFPYVFVPLATEPSGYDTYGEAEEMNVTAAGPWLPTAAEIGLGGWVPPLKRSVQIDPTDPVEALDDQTDFYGFHIV